MSFNHAHMRIKRDYPYTVRTIENSWITLKDGTRLAARIWLPEGAEQTPVPAILEYLPYRKNDMTAWRDSIRHPYLAGHGYACIRVDMRGNGDSDGLMLDEYTQQELDDCVEVLQWLDDQPWCTGKVGMFGKSWGGFNALQVAAMRPPQLKAIITIASTDDRYADDVHYMGGSLLAYEMLSWASTMLCYNACPPDPRFVGDRWRDMWLHRLNNTPPFAEAWVGHQRRDEFWQHGSVSQNYADIECAVYAVGGWADGYTNAVGRLLHNLSCPKKGLIGPWAHNFPENSSPAPAIGFLQEHLRWWDYWLKGEETGIMDEPMLRSWIMDSLPPSVDRRAAPGRWVADPSWTSPNVMPNTIDLTPDAPIALKGQQITGLDAPPWLAFGSAGEYPADQSGDDGRSIALTTEPQQSGDILGHPQVSLRLQVDQPQAALSVRLCDVAPDGSSSLVTWGIYNLTHRFSHEEPQLMPIGQSISVVVDLNLIGYRLATGHSWRVSISPTYWPHLWPAPQPVTLTVETCQLILPSRTPSPADNELAPFDVPECSEQMHLEQLVPGRTMRTVQFDRVNNSAEHVNKIHSPSVRYPDGLELSEYSADVFTITENDPLSAAVKCMRNRRLVRDGWRVSVWTESTMTADADNFYLVNRLNATEDMQIVFDHTWTKTIPRDFQ
ncbi:MAG: CocE/NonD family hydrolase [Candidatus Promineifilaceae bacterium]